MLFEVESSCDYQSLNRQRGVALPIIVILSSLTALTPMQWLGLVHPVLIILFVYPVVGATIRLGILVRERRLQINPIAATVPIEHADHGRWVTAGVVVAVLIAMTHDVASLVMANHSIDFSMARLVSFAAVESAVIIAFLCLARSQRTAVRLGCGLSCWLGLLLIGTQLDAVRGSDWPLSFAFWQSHYWGGVALTGLLLLSMALHAEIVRRPGVRRLHVAINVLVGLLLAMQAISGTRNLLI